MLSRGTCVDHTGHEHLCFEAHQVLYHVARAAECELFLFRLDDLHRRFGRDSVYMAPYVFVDHEIAHNQDGCIHKLRQGFRQCLNIEHDMPAPS